MRGSTGSSLDERITALELELLSLRREVAALARRLPSVSDEDLRPLVVGPADGRVGESPGLLGQSDALRRVATISFVLVVALLLRTLTDNGIVHPRLGVLLGIAYAWLLVAIGWQRLASGRNGRNVFPICGVALLSALVLESHARFGLLPALPAHALLGAAAVVALMLARRHGAPAVAEAGCLAPAVAAAAMRFPTPEFPMAAGVLLLCGVTAALAAGLRRIAWVHWPVAASSACLWFVWTWKLHAPLARGDAVGPGLWLDWFLPMLTVTFVAQVATGVLVGRRSPTPFWIGSPVWAVAWSFAAAAAVALPEFGAERWLGAAALGVAGLGGGLTRRAGRSQAAALVFAALVAFVPGTWLFAGTWWITLPLWAAASLVLAAASERFSSGSLRLVALLLPSGTLLAAVAAGCCTVPQPSPALAALLGVVLCAIAAAHYAWSRRHPPPAGSRYARLQPSDRVAILSLCAAASAAFCAARVLLHPFLARLPVDRDAAFAGGQSVLLALLSVALLLLARATTSRAMLSTAVLAGVVTGFKVFASDFLTLRGLPLVTSVFAFGATAAIGSFVLGRWPRTRPATDDPATGAP